MKDMEGKDRMMDEKAEIMVTGENPRETCTESGDEAEGNELYVRFRKPYVFEEDTYRGIDLSGLERLSANDIIEIEKRFYRLGITSVNPENTVAYAKVVAQKASGLPVEFFEDLPAREILRVKGKIVNFFFG